MLSDKTIKIVKSTAPILEEQGEALTRHFYKRMFTHNPEVAPLFNPANQHAGSQQRALAAAICAYAGNIDNLEVLGGAVELIAQKHASLRILPEHYPIVGANLLASIREVLGAGATDEVIEAWGAAYNFLADILIAREAQIYAEQAVIPGGWTDFKKFRVMRKEKESSIITSFYLVPEAGGAVPHYKAGQFITVRMPGPDGITTMRNYSLSDAPGQDYLRISVKRETGPKADTPKGYVSNMLHDNVEVGATIEVAPPCGEFFLDIEATKTSQKPLVLLAGGIGITPILSIVKTALRETPQRPVTLIHACLNEEVQAFRKDLDALAAAHPQLKIHHRYSEAPSAGMTRHSADSTGFVDEALFDMMVPVLDADYYFCGPKPFMVEIYHMLLNKGAPPAQIYFEFFGPKQELERKAA